MTRNQFIEKELRQIYGGYIPDDSEITFELANKWLSEGLGTAAKLCYKESIQIDAVGYVNNSFYTTFKGLSVTKDEQFLFKITLPQIPIGIGENQGVETLILFDSIQNSYPVIWLSQKERGFQKGRRKVPNKLLGYLEGQYAYIESVFSLTDYTAKATMISGGDSTDLDSVLNMPDDYYPIVSEYIKAQLGFERMQPNDQVDDGTDTK